MRYWISTLLACLCLTVSAQTNFPPTQTLLTSGQTLLTSGQVTPPALSNGVEYATVYMARGLHLNMAEIEETNPVPFVETRIIVNADGSVYGTNYDCGFKYQGRAGIIVGPCVVEMTGSNVTLQALQPGGLIQMNEGSDCYLPVVDLDANCDGDTMTAISLTYQPTQSGRVEKLHIKALLARLGIRQPRAGKTFHQPEHELIELFQEARSKYRTAIKRVHPDRCGEDERCKQLNIVWARIERMFERRGIELTPL